MDSRVPTLEIRPSGFQDTVIAQTERRSYPHRSRADVGQVPEPRYKLQEAFQVTNYAFKGYGLPSGVAPPNASTSATVSPPPYGTYELTDSALTASRRPLSGRPKGVDLNAQGIDKERFSFGVTTNRSSASTMSACLQPHGRSATGTGVRGTIVAPLVSSSLLHHPTTTATHEHGDQNAAAGATPREHGSRPRIAREPPSQVRSLLNYGDHADFCRVQRFPPPPVEQSTPAPPPCETRHSTACSPLPTGGRPSSGRNRPTDSELQQQSQELNPMNQRKTKDELKQLLVRCGSLFRTVSVDASAFERVWAASLDHVGDNKVNVAVFRSTMEKLRL